MSIGEILKHILESHTSPKTRDKRGPGPNPETDAGPMRASGAAAGPTRPQPPGANTARGTQALPEAAPDPTSASQDGTGAAAEAAVLSFATRIGQVPLGGWWTDDKDDVFVDVRATDQGQLIVLHLSPPGLGPITVVLTFCKGRLDTQIVVEEEAAAGRITARIAQLRLSLAEVFAVEDIRVVERPQRVRATDVYPRSIIDMNA